MKYYCGTCKSKLKPVKIERGEITERISYKILFVETQRAYKCPKGCELKTVLKNAE
jgi:DNA-directed RNA polymerase subunit RPC12/RpoP